MNFTESGMPGGGDTWRMGGAITGDAWTWSLTIHGLFAHRRFHPSDISPAPIFKSHNPHFFSKKIYNTILQNAIFRQKYIIQYGPLWVTVSGKTLSNGLYLSKPTRTSQFCRSHHIYPRPDFCAGNIRVYQKTTARQLIDTDP